MRSELFADANQETRSTERWVKQSSKMLRISVVGGDVLAAKGAMVAYQGRMEFQHEGAGAARMLKKLVTGEGAPPSTWAVSAWSASRARATRCCSIARGSRPSSTRTPPSAGRRTCSRASSAA